ncbi:hypothetical protein GTO27_03340 [Candidatus Bathyarchaeota archaeon]|nr:hypothetical protein [Candidatus Bathyarchaeota archaeon]
MKKNQITLVFLCLVILFPIAFNKAVAAPDALMFVDPANIIDTDLEPCSDITITINASTVPNLFTWQIKLWFDPSIINCTDAYYPPGHVFDGMGFDSSRACNRQRQRLRDFWGFIDRITHRC